MEKSDQLHAMSKAQWVAKLSLLAETNREAYRALREVMWQFVVENSGNSEFPSDMS
jgi:hypothetical protein